jgi:hypothetical protein
LISRFFGAGSVGASGDKEAAVCKACSFKKLESNDKQRSQNGAIITPTFVFSEEPIFQATQTKTFNRGDAETRRNHAYF